MSLRRRAACLVSKDSVKRAGALLALAQKKCRITDIADARTPRGFDISRSRA